MMSPGIFAIGLHRRERGALGDRHGRGHVGPAHMRAEDVAGCEQAECLAIGGIERDGLFEQSLRGGIVLAGDAPVMRQCAHHEVPGIQASRRLLLGAKTLGGIELRLDRGDDRLGDLVLHREDVGKLAVVSFGPEMAAGRDVVELRGDTHAIAAPPHAAFEHVAHAELARDLVHVHRAALVDEGGVARDDEEPAQLRQRGDDVLADPVGEIILLAVATHVGEGEHRDRRPVR